MQMRPKALVQELKAGRKTEEPGQTGKEGRTREGFSVREGEKASYWRKADTAGPGGNQDSRQESPLLENKEGRQK